MKTSKRWRPSESLTHPTLIPCSLPLPSHKTVLPMSTTALLPIAMVTIEHNFGGLTEQRCILLYFLLVIFSAAVIQY